MTQPIDLDALQASAEAATPGPWQECGHNRGGCRCAQIWSSPVDFPVATAFKGDEELGMAPKGKPEANAAFIAAANPAVVDELIARLRKAEAALKEVEKTAIRRGDKYLCDAIDNTGEPYQSQWLTDILATPSDSGREGCE